MTGPLRLLQAGLRYWWHRPLQAALTVLGVALGVALAVGIAVANRQAVQSFELSADRVAGRATHALVGTDLGLPDSLYRWLRIRQQLHTVAPVAEGQAQAPDGTWVTLLGIDPLAEGPFRPYSGQTSPGGSQQGLPLAEFIAYPGSCVLAEEVADRWGLAVGSTFTVRVAGVPRTLRLVATLAPADAYTRQLLSGLIVTDIGTAQYTLGLQGTLSRIDLIMDDGAAQGLRARLPPGIMLERAALRTQRLTEMTRAFRLNLAALSMLALVVGMLLIYNAVHFSVVRRHGLWGSLRALGVTPAQLRRTVMAEALVMGVAGTALGLLGGWALAHFFTHLLAGSISELYATTQALPPRLDAYTFSLGVVLGLGATGLSAYGPAQEASRIPPRQLAGAISALGRFRRRQRWVAAAGALAALIGAGGLLLPATGVLGAYLGLAACLLAYALWVPWPMRGLLRLLAPVAKRLLGAVGALTVRGMAQSLNRTAVAVAALGVAVAAVIGVRIMVLSFRDTVVSWLNTALEADVYLSPPGPLLRRNEAALPPQAVKYLLAQPQVQAASMFRGRLVQQQEHTYQLLGFDMPEATRRTYRFTAQLPQVWQQFQAGKALISEPFAYRYGLTPGDSLTLPTPDGPWHTTVAAIYLDYGSDLGVVQVARQHYITHYADSALTGIGLFLKPGTDAEAFVTQARPATAALGAEVNIRSNATLRKTSLEVFDRTFVITQGLRTITLVVAFAGMLGALLAWELQRQRERALLRAIGLSPRQTGTLVWAQSTLLGLTAGITALPLGWLLAYGLTYAVNQRSFGWTLQFQPGWGWVLEALALAATAAALAGLMPAWQVARRSIVQSLHTE